MAQEQEIKPRRYDLAPDEFLAGVAGEMTEAELGVYWMICLLQYSRRGPIKYDMQWLRRKFKASRGLWGVEPIVQKLIASGRVVRDGDEIYVRRVSDEVEKAQRRVRDAVEIGSRGGRPSNKANGLEKGSGFTMPRARHAGQPQPQPLENLSSSSLPSSARAPLPNGGAEHARGDETGTWRQLGQLADTPPPPNGQNNHDRRVQQHIEWLKASALPRELELYLAAALSDDPDAAQRMFELTEARMTTQSDP